MRDFLEQFAVDESGATAIEYSLIAAGVALAIIAAVQALGTAVDAKFEAVNASLH